jgi:tape measure domain-containing protein
MANLYFEATLDAEQLKRSIAETNRLVKGMTKNVQQQGAEMDATFKRIGAAMAGYFSITAAKGFIGEMVKVRGEFQQLDIALQTMLGSKAESDALMAEVVELAAKTPFSLTELGQGAKRLLAFKEPVDQVGDSLRRLGDLAAGASAPVGDLIQVYGKVSAKGKMQAEELNQFAERGIPIISELAAVVGATDKEIYKMAEQGKIGFPELQQAIKNMTNEGGMFFNLMEKQSASLTGQISNMGDAWDRALNEMGKNNEGALNSSIEGITYLIENYETVIDTLKVIIATYGAYRGAIIAANLALKAQAAMGAIQAWVSLARGIKSAKDAQIAFNLASKMNPWGLAAAGIAALVTGFALFANKTKQATGVSAAFSRDLESQTKAIDANFKALKGATEGTDARKIAIDQINSKYGPYLENLMTEKSTLEEIETAQRRATQELAKAISFKAQQADLEKFRETIEKSETAFSQALKGLFALNDIPAEIGGQLSAELDKLVNEWSSTNIQNRVGFGESFSKIFKDAGVEVDLLGTKGNNAYRGLFESMQSVINARQQETKATEDLSTAYDAYLKQLGLTGEGKSKTVDPRMAETVTDMDKFRSKLEDQESAYDDYFDAIRNARDEDRDSIKEYYKDLIAQGEDFEEYLKNQLETVGGNVEKTIAIYQAAAKAKITIDADEPKKIKRRPTTETPTIAPSNKDMARLREAQQKYNAIYERIRNVAENQQNMDLAGNMIDAAYAGQDLASAVGQFDKNLGEGLSKMADITGSIGNVVGAFSSGDPMAMVSGVASLIGSIGSLFDNTASKQRQAAFEAEKLHNLFELQNRALERQVQLMNEASGEDRVKAERETTALIEKQQKEALDRIKSAKMVIDTGVYNALDQENFTREIKLNLEEGNEIRDLEKKIQEATDAGYKIDNQDELLKMLDEYYRLQALQKEVTENIVGTTPGSIADAIVQGFKDGKSAVEDFADTFEDLMIDAVMNSFKTQAIMAAIQPFYDEMDKRMADGSLDADDTAYLTGMWKKIMKGLEIKFDGVTEMLTEGLGYDPFAAMKEDSLSGAIKGVSEETASILAGQMNAIRINQSESLRIMNESVRYQAQIAVNTGYNQHLEGIHSEIKAIRVSGSDLKSKGL